MKEEEKKAIDKINRQITIGRCEKNIAIPVYICDLETALNLIETQKAELEPIKKLNIPVETLVAEFNRLEDLEDNTVMLKAEIEKKDNQLKEKNNIINKTSLEAQRYFDTTIEQALKFDKELKKKDKQIDLMAEQLTTPINGKEWVIEYYTKLAEENKQ